MTRNSFQRPPYYDWGLDRWKLGAALFLFAFLLIRLLTAPPTPMGQPVPPPAPMLITLTEPAPGVVEAGISQSFRGIAPPNSPVLIVDTQMGELGRTLAQADGVWTLTTASPWAAGAYRLQAVVLDPITGQPLGRSTVVPVVALSSPRPPLTLEKVDISSDGLSLSLAGQAPPGVTVSVFTLAGERRIPLDQTQADSNARWQMQSPAPADVAQALPLQVVLVASDPTGAVLAESGPTALFPSPDAPQIVKTEATPAQSTPGPSVANPSPAPTSQTTAEAPPGLPVIVQPGMAGRMAPGDLRFAGTALPGSRLRLEFGRSAPASAEDLAGELGLELPAALAWVANDGSWSVGLGELLPPGRYGVQAVALDPAGAESGRSLPVDFEVIQATAPVVETSPTAPSPVTVGTRFPRFSGQAEANRLLLVQTVDGAGETQQGYVSAGPDGRWTFVPAFPLAPGVTKATVQVVGAPMTARDDLVVQILEEASLSGALATGLQVMSPSPGWLTNRLSPIYGLAPAGAQVTVRLNNQVAATVQANAHGNWYALPPTPLDVGDHRLVVSDDRGGEVGPLVLTVTAETPTIPAPALDPAPIQADHPARLTVTGVAQPGQAVEILLNGRRQATVTADGLGRWRWQPAQDQPDGPVYVQARLVGPVGEVISASEIRVAIYSLSLGE